MADEKTVIVLGPPQFGSPNPDTLKNHMFEGTQAKRVVGLNDDAVPADTEPANDGEMKAGDWKAEVEAVDSQEALDEVADRYATSGSDFKTVEAAIEKKQDELNSAAADNGNNDAGNGQ